MTALTKQQLQYTGKVKSLYATNDPNYLIMEFRDDTTSLDGLKKEQLARKGFINNHFNAFIMRYLEDAGIATQFVRLYSDTETVVKHLEMIRVESVVRNLAAGHLCSRLGVEEGIDLDPPIFEFFLKDDARHDPMISESTIITFKWASAVEIAEMKALTLRVNEILKPLFLRAGLLLVDFKLEFGRYAGKLILGDEFTLDGSRVWDSKTRKKLDKDRFRKDLGEVVESYELVAQRLGIDLTATA